MVYDAHRARSVLFGGIVCDGVWFACTFYDDTWEWDGTAWTQVFPATVPPWSAAQAVAFDEGRGVVTMFGGWNGSALAGTWEWDGVDWSQRAPATSPPARGYAAMAYDAHRSRSVLFGGITGTGAPLGDTWEWDGSDWTQAAPAVQPPSRWGHSMVYDSARSRIVLFGGAEISSTTWNDTWEWDGLEWSLRTPPVSPPPRAYAAAAFDPSDGATVLFGGEGSGLLGDTWRLASATPAAATPFGSGCPGTAGTPYLQATNLPWIGSTFEGASANVPPAAPFVVLVLGFSDAQWGGFPLPLDLGLVGMPSCSLYAAVDATFAVAASGGSAAWSFAVPADSSLAGGHAFFQAWVPDPAATPLGATTTNALDATFGIP